MIAHDLRSPAAAIQMGLAEFSRKFGDDPQASWRIRMMEAQVARALSVAEEVADLVAIHAGQLRLQLVALEFGMLVERVVREGRKPRGRKVVFARPAGAAWVLGDEARLSRLLAALIAEAQQRASTVSTLSLRSRDGWALLEIVDDGPPAAPEQLDALLEGRLSEAYPARGFGLRLAAARETIAGHGGTLNVSAAEAGGIRTTLRLPERPDLALIG